MPCALGGGERDVGIAYSIAPVFELLLSAAVVAVMSGVAITFFQNFLPNQAGSATNVYSSSARIGATAGYLGRRDRRTGIGQCSA